ncbi:hypothetical protein ACIQC5_20100 [Paenarthrobacter sp. NPDC092416]|uniref:hypothetical protein n=1 Tax=Paenarthrobacter sp. NPDC092416 TaxID=3364386 RepID=UPI003814B7FC
METEAGFLGTESSDWSYSEDACFLCLSALNDSNRTKEHVFPKWLLKRHGLINETVTLQNGTYIPYRQLTIPSCLECNGTHLSQMESTVRAAFELGFDGVKAMDRRVLFLWLAKIFYGLLVKERSSLLDRKDADGPTIVRDEDLGRFAMHHFLMQNVRGTAAWVGSAGENPWSIFVLKCQVSEAEPHLNFDYVDSNEIPFLAIRSGDIAVIASLQDWGHLETDLEVQHLVAAQQLELHPLQFKEAAVVAGYLSMAFFHTRRFVLVQGEKQTTAILMPNGSTSPNFDPELVGLAPSLAHHFGVDVDQVTDGRRVISTLSSADGSPFQMHWDGSSNYPKPTIHPVGLEAAPPERPIS